MIIDFHTHVFPEKIAAATVAALEKSSGNHPHADGTVKGLLGALSDAGADVAVNLPVLTKPSQFDSIMRFADAINSTEFEGARIISFAGINPDEEDVWGRLRAVKDAGMLGIKIHPDYQNKFIDDPAYVRIFEAAKALDLIVVTHAGLDAAYVGEPIKCTPERVLRLLDRIGGYGKLVLAHIGGNMLHEDVLSMLAGLDVYFDTAYSLHGISEEFFKKILDKHGDDKILFATDSPWQNIQREIDIIKSYRLGAESEEKIFSANAIKLLGIEKNA